MNEGIPQPGPERFPQAPALPEGLTEQQAESVLQQLSGAFAGQPPPPPTVPTLLAAGAFLAGASAEAASSATPAGAPTDAPDGLGDGIYRTLVEQLPIVMFVAQLQADTSEIYVSPYIEGLLGYTQQEWVQDPVLWYERLHPDDKERWNVEFSRVIMLDEPFCSVYEFIARDGRVVWVRGEAKIIRDQAGHPLFVQGFGLDITELKQAEAALHRAHDELERRVEARTAELAGANTALQAEIAERRRAETEVRRGQALLAEAEHLAQIGHWEWDIRTDTVTWSDEFYRIHGLQPQACRITRAIALAFVHPADRAISINMSDKACQNHEPYAHYHRIIRQDGVERIVHMRGVLETDEADQPIRLFGTGQDVTERRQAEADIMRSRDFYLTLFETFPALVWRSGPDGQCNYFNRAWLDFTGRSLEQEWGSGWVENVHPEDVDRCLQTYLTAFQARQPFEMEYRLRRYDGEYRWLLDHGQPFNGLDDKFAGYIGSCYDITERKEVEARLQHDAHHDALTGLPNRAFFMHHLQQAMAQLRRHPEARFAVLFLDLDRFKVVNDSLGHSVGDQLLVATAERLKRSLRDTDVVARLGGDEFTVLLVDLQDVNDASLAAERIQEQMSRPFHLLLSPGEKDRSWQEVFATASIGIALSDTHYDDADGPLRDADAAMYRAKAQGKARYEMFDTALRASALAQLQLETDLRRALERGELRVAYQPIVELASQRIIGFEALVRWQHSERGFISPAEFIPIAEETGLIVSLDRAVLREACRQTVAWQAQFPAQPPFPPLTISVNFSAKQFSQPDLVEQVVLILRETGLEACSLRLEITESAIMENPANATVTLAALRALRVQLYMDDFGTGYSSLSHLHRFPINTLKIDRSFVSRMGDEGQELEIVRAIVMLAHGLHIAVVAEGVETAAQLAQLQALQCEYGQGYFFSKPLDGDAATALLARRELGQ